MHQNVCIKSLNVSVQKTNVKKKTMHKNFYTTKQTCCSSHLEPKVILNGS